MGRKARDEYYQYGDPPPPTDLPADTIISPDTRRADRLPPGQVRTRKWPVLDASGAPAIQRADWRLRVCGLVETPTEYDADRFCRLPRQRIFADFHCVTRWSRLGNLWEGVSTRKILESCGVLPDARFVILHAYDRDWTTNLPLEDFLAVDALLADTLDDNPIPIDHGGPVRAVIPQRYAWKSAKWLRTIELCRDDRPGYWERAGYHPRGDPWSEQRRA